MCGLAGIFGTPAIDREPVARRMATAIISRGPDDEGVWSDKEAGIFLAHRRLSILDLTTAGHQPMASACGRYIIAFNGEIYNHRALRAEIEAALGLSREAAAARWRGHSDTEVLLAAVSNWGLIEALRRAVGMFALAVWDRATRTLQLARDRVGEKPLYYSHVGGCLRFASELKALHADPAWQPQIDRDALALYMRHAYVPAPHTIYRETFKVQPGTVLSFRSGNEAPVQQTYWSAWDVASKAASGLTGSADAFPAADLGRATDALEAVLGDAIELQMVADVPLGAFLSGGIDSSTIVALMQARSTRPVRTFTIGFDEGGYDEAVHAKAVARYLGTEHTELYVSAGQALSVVDSLPQMFDEPFGDSSQIPTFLVAQMARQHVTVSLSGDAGDELLGGYNRYFLARGIWDRVRGWPLPMRRAIASVLQGVTPERWNRLIGAAPSLLPARYRHANPGDKLHKLAGMLDARSMREVYRRLVSLWNEPGHLVRGSREPQGPLCDERPWRELGDPSLAMMYLDLLTYLPDDILVKVDRAAMAVGLETRVPLLDHRVIEFAWRLPVSMKVRGGIGKLLLREVLYRHVPRALVERPKMGFGIPLDAWLRGPLRAWAEDLLDESRLRSQGFLDPETVRLKWTEHLSGRRNWQYALWNVLMFQAWYAHWHERKA
ncbi:MAG: asparagine synthase (glutamine-hydrolyzing) [Sterolibacteriaceae bacterium]|uniref:asparagine synthase (glutamine-hydrolyzing) n=1 Tax=Candidatus Methylophosphatis roskildensis TaxID=2899263 RepID=A0A9D7E0Z1_9PROT|nr:asparagine synthase (glutamine-hydrolyzing) [Candidatus Methylophosphatis roskildensis]MBK7238484.1 asparagine synthase (glutamine-hydrolyzing) [Sterolibacteriaceae bacterium]